MININYKEILVIKTENGDKIKYSKMEWIRATVQAILEALV